MRAPDVDILVMLRGDKTVRIAGCYTRIAKALGDRPYRSSSARMKIARRLVALGFSYAEVPDAGWVSLAHLARAGWCP